MGSFDMTNEMKSYFDSLPMNIQQELTESGVKMNSLESLKEAVKNMTGENDERQL